MSQFQFVGTSRLFVLQHWPTHTPNSDVAVTSVTFPLCFTLATGDQNVVIEQNSEPLGSLFVQVIQAQLLSK